MGLETGVEERRRRRRRGFLVTNGLAGNSPRRFMPQDPIYIGQLMNEGRIPFTKMIFDWIVWLVTLS